MTAFHPHLYQTYAIRRIVDGPAVGLMLDMGLGKTVITLTAVRELIYERLDVRRALVIAPKKVAEATWQAEGEKWEHLSDLRFSTVLGDAKARRAALAERFFNYYESKGWVVGKSPMKNWQAAIRQWASRDKQEMPAPPQPAPPPPTTESQVDPELRRFFAARYKKP